MTDPFPRIDPQRAEFGRWLCEQRQLRGLSRSFVAARTRIRPERIEAIERGGGALCDDALGRGAVRQLAGAIGADPLEALARLGWSGAPPRGVRAGPLLSARVALWTGGIAGLAAAAALLWVGVSWLDRAGDEARPAIVYRPDYVDELVRREPATAARATPR